MAVLIACLATTFVVWREMKASLSRLSCAERHRVYVFRDVCLRPCACLCLCRYHGNSACKNRNRATDRCERSCRKSSPSETRPAPKTTVCDRWANVFPWGWGWVGALICSVCRTNSICFPILESWFADAVPGFSAKFRGRGVHEPMPPVFNDCLKSAIFVVVV